MNVTLFLRHQEIFLYSKVGAGASSENIYDVFRSRGIVLEAPHLDVFL